VRDEDPIQDKFNLLGHWKTMNICKKKPHMSDLNFAPKSKFVYDVRAFIHNVLFIEQSM